MQWQTRSGYCKLQLINQLLNCCRFSSNHGGSGRCTGECEGYLLLKRHWKALCCELGPMEAESGELRIGQLMDRGSRAIACVGFGVAS